MDDGSPGLAVGFTIETGGSFAALAQLSAAMDSTEAKVLREAQSIERATSGMINLGSATASVQGFGNAYTREVENIARAKAQAEKQAESLIRQLDREAAAIGKTREEMQAAKVETAALAAARLGLTEVSDRLLASARARAAVASALAEDKEAAIQRDLAAAARERAQAEQAVMTQLRERAQLEAALDRTMGLDRPSAAQAGATFSALAERERELELVEKTAAAEQAVLAATRQQNNLLAERAQIEAALARTTGTDRPRATDAGATFSALAARAAEEEARAHDLAAAAVKREADEQARLIALVRGSQAAQEADAAAAERLRERTDPLYAATKRLNTEIAESTRLYHVGATAPAEYARQQQVLTERLGAAQRQHVALAGAAGRSGFALQQFAIQMPDIAQGLLTGQKPMTVFIQQGGQLVQIAMMAQGGIRGFAAELGAAALAAAPFLAVIGAVAGVVAVFAHEIQQDAALKAYVDGLGLTQKEMKKLGDVSITTGDKMSGLWKTLSDQIGASKALDGFGDKVGAVMHQAYLYFLQGGEAFTAILKASYDTIIAQWRQFPAAFGNLVIEGVNVSIKAVQALVNTAIDGINLLQHTSLPHLNLGSVTSPFAKAGHDAAESWSSAYQRRLKEAQAQDAQMMAAWNRNTLDAAERRLKEKADKIRGDRTPKTDHHAEQLAREAAAMEAQIANLYKLADAYSVSGAAALIAEARVKAESAAIKQRGDVEEAVNRQVRLAIAQRVADGAKSAATMRDQARVQTEVNGMVAAGTIPAERAAELLQQRMAELPLLQAIEAAQQRGLATEATRATNALEAQRDAQAQARAAAVGARVVADAAAGERRLAELREELRLVGATDQERIQALTTIRATNEAIASGRQGQQITDYVAQQVAIAVGTQRVADATRDLNDALFLTSDRWDIIAGKVQAAGQSMADAFGSAGRAVGDLAGIYASYQAQRTRAEAEHTKALRETEGNTARTARENQLFALRSSGAQISAYGDMAAAAKGFFKEGSAGYQALAAAEKVYRIAQFAMSVQAMVQNAAETLGFVTNSAARSVAAGTEGIATQSKLPFPFNIAAMAATAAALVAAGIAVFGGGGGAKVANVTNTGTGTVLGDPTAKSDSIKNAINALQQVDRLMLTSSREMAASLRSIDQQIGGLASVLVRSGNISADSSVAQGFKPNAIGSVLSKIPLIGGFLGGLFGSTTTVKGSGLYAGGQSIGDILGGGFNAQTYSDVEKVKKFFGITTGRSTSTVYGGSVDASVSDQFTLILRSFNDAIVAAAGPLGASTSDIAAKVSGFVFNLGKVDLSGLSGAEIQEKLTNVFGAAADQMAAGAFPGIERFQKVGEGALETLVRVSSTVESVTAALTQLGAATAGLGIDAKVGLAAQFDSIGDLTNAVGAYFEAFYTPAEQAAAKAAQLGTVFASLGLTMPDTLAAFRQLVEAQDLTTAAGQSTYATLLQLAPAFGELKSSMDGAKSAADILSERQDLQRQLLELRGDTAAIQALDLAKLDASNRALQQEVWATKAANDLADAWKSVGQSIADEITRIRGLTGASASGGFSVLQGQFNAATAAARAGDQDAAKSLPGLSQALLTAAAAAATSRQELDRVQAQTAASLEQTKAAIDAMTSTSAVIASASTAATLAAAASAQGASSSPTAANDDTAAEVRALREELAAMRSDTTAGLAAVASNTGRTARTLDSVTADSAGTALSVAAAR